MNIYVISWYKQQNIWLRRVIVSSLFLSLSFIAFILFLLFISNWLIYVSPLQQADVIRIDQTGKQLNTAVDLFRQGYAPAILIHTEVSSKYIALSDFDPQGDVMVQKLVEGGIPKEDIFRLRSTKSDFYNKRKDLYRWVNENHKQSVILLPSIYDSRREKMVATRLSTKGDIQVVILPISTQYPLRIRLVEIENAFVSYMYIRLFEN